MYHINNIIEWFLGCWKAVPANIVTGVFTGLCIWIARFVINKVILYNDKLKKVLGKVTAIWRAQPDIEIRYKVIPSPQYDYSKRNKKVNSSSQNIEGLLFGVIIFSIIGCLWLKKHQEEVQTFFYLASVLLIGLSTFFILMSAFTNQIQSSTLKFSVFSIAISAYVYYSGLVLPQLIEKIPPDINVSKFFIEPKKYWSSIYVFLGLVIVVIEIFIMLLMLIRVIVIKINSKVQLKVCKKVICFTNCFENVIGLGFLFLALTIFSYLLSSNIFIDMIFK